MIRSSVMPNIITLLILNFLTLEILDHLSDIHLMAVTSELSALRIKPQVTATKSSTYHHVIRLVLQMEHIVTLQLDFIQNVEQTDGILPVT